MADLSVTSSTFGKTLTAQSDNLLAGVTALANGTGDAGTNMTIVIKASANIAAVQAAASKERESYKALESA
jgi:hypothetical protein